MDKPFTIPLIYQGASWGKKRRLKGTLKGGRAIKKNLILKGKKVKRKSSSPIRPIVFIKYSKI